MGLNSGFGSIAIDPDVSRSEFRGRPKSQGVDEASRYASLPCNMPEEGPNNS